MLDKETIGIIREQNKRKDEGVENLGAVITEEKQEAVVNQDKMSNKVLNSFVAKIANFNYGMEVSIRANIHGTSIGDNEPNPIGTYEDLEDNDSDPEEEEEPEFEQAGIFEERSIKQTQPKLKKPNIMTKKKRGPKSNKVKLEMAASAKGQRKLRSRREIAPLKEP